MIWYMFAFYGSPPSPKKKKKRHSRAGIFFEVSGCEFPVLLLQCLVTQELVVSLCGPKKNCQPSFEVNHRLPETGDKIACVRIPKKFWSVTVSALSQDWICCTILDHELWICEILKTKQKHTDDNSTHLHSNPFISIIVLQALHEAWAFEDREVIQACIVMVLEAEDFQVMLQPCMSKKWWVSETIFSLKQWHLP